MKVFILSIFLAFASFANGLQTLRHFVMNPDPATRILETEVFEKKMEGYKLLTFRFVSQNWLTPQEVSNREWTHWMSVVIPDKLKTRERALLYISNGINPEDRPKEAHPIIAHVALKTGAITAELRGIPNQPLEFFGDGKKRIEDDLIAFAWDQYFKTQDPKWVPSLPMMKATSASMDFLTEILAKHKIANLKKFTLAGASKRGWVVWLMPLVDKRIEAIAPMVIDLLSVKESMKHHRESLGTWSQAVKDYVGMQITDRIESEKFATLMNLIDPIEYLENLTLPKLVINASNDQFFVPDSSQFYFSKLKGEKSLLYLANNGHNIAQDRPKYFDTITYFFDSVGKKRPMPKLKWSLVDENLRISSPETPASTILWEAHNETSRDFRMMSKEFPAYKSSELQCTKNLELHLTPPAKGWKASFVEMIYKKGSQNISLSTEIYIVQAKDPSRK